MAKHLHPASNSFRQSHVELYDFALPAAAAMWNLRWQVRGYLETKPDVSATELSHRFVFGSGLNYRNLRAPFENTTWANQQDQFARFLLTNLVSLFEGYVAELEVVYQTPGLAKQLQFPSAGATSRRTPGICDALTELTQRKSAAMEASFASALAKQPRFMGDHLDALMIMYRYFKEVRNAFAHRNGIAEPYMEGTYKAVTELSSWPLRPDLAAEVPPIVGGERVTITWRNMQSFSELLLVVVTTVDTILASTPTAEAIFLDTWRAKHGTRFIKGNLPSDEGKRGRRLQNLIVALGLPRPDDPERLFALLRRHRLAS